MTKINEWRAAKYLEKRGWIVSYYPNEHRHWFVGLGSHGGSAFSLRKAIKRCMRCCHRGDGDLLRQAEAREAMRVFLGGTGVSTLSHKKGKRYGSEIMLGESYPGKGLITYDQSEEMSQNEIDILIQQRFFELLETEGEDAAYEMKWIAEHTAKSGDIFMSREDYEAEIEDMLPSW